MKRTLCLVIATLFAVCAFAAAPIKTATVFVDTTDAHRGVFHSHLSIPAAAGPLTLVYPKWIPGEHMPTGPLMQVVGLHVHAGDREIAWRRDPVDMFAFHIDVPAGIDAVEVDLDFLSAASTFGNGYGESANATQKLLLVLFNHVVIYPAGVPIDQFMVRASLKLPAGWKFETALPVDRQDGDRVEFQPVSLTTLVDSPIVAGEFMRIVAVAEANRLVVTADSAQALALNDARIGQLRNLVAETDALFGARHYRYYRWLVTLSDLIEPQGLEHHESTDIRARESGLTEPDWTARTITILSHEFVHSWNGKYRRPAGLATPDYQQPMIGELLYVYEGMTRYLGDLVLTARSGMRTPQEDREFAAWVSANQDRNRPGRNWRPLADTAVAVSSIGQAPNEDAPYRRGFDYYDESMLVWLDADTIIRTKSGGAKSLDDFAKIFFGVPAKSVPSVSEGSGRPGGATVPVFAPTVSPYTLDDLVAALNKIVPYDWRSFLESRVYRVAPHPPLGALDASGWRLVYNDTPNWYMGVRDRSGQQLDASFSLGMWVKEDGTITDVVYGSAAYSTGLAPLMKISAVGSRKYSEQVLREEIRAAKSSPKPIEVSVVQGTFAGTFSIDYHGGEQFPHLERIEGRPDLLSDIMRPHAKP